MCCSFHLPNQSATNTTYTHPSYSCTVEIWSFDMLWECCNYKFQSSLCKNLKNFTVTEKKRFVKEGDVSLFVGENAESVR